MMFPTLCRRVFSIVTLFTSPSTIHHC
jgi:hypothetical protein